jgi:outer membrane protein
MRFKTIVPLAVFSVARLAAQAPAKPHLTLEEAEALALKNHPQVQAAVATSLATKQTVIESRSAYFPAIDGEITGSQGNNNGRIGAGSLTDSRLFNRFGQGIEVSQLISDSGRTPNLVANSRLHAQASDQSVQATRFNVLLNVVRSYFDTLRAEALVRLADQTVAARQLVDDQVTELGRQQLRSLVDVGFADVSLSQSRLLRLKAGDQLEEAYAILGRSLGSQDAIEYQLSDEPLPPGPPSGVQSLIAQAFSSRPELAAQRLDRDAANRFTQAEKDLKYPTVSFVGVGGFQPFVNQVSLPRLIPHEYEGAAVNVDIPIFNGHLFSAREEAARQQANAADQKVRDLEDQVAQEVRIASARAMTAFQQIDVTAQMLRQAALALNLSQSRYNLGLSSIVEVTQAQLSLTNAEIDNLNAKYDYQIANGALQYAIGQLR